MRKSAAMREEVEETPELEVIESEDDVIEEDSLEDEVVEDDLEEGVEEEPVEDAPAPTAYTPEQLQEITTKAAKDAVEEYRKASAPVAEQPKPEPVRPPMELANEWASANGITDYDKIQAKAMEIHGQQVQQAIIGQLSPYLAPIITTSTIMEASGGDAAIASSLREMVDKQAIGIGDFANPEARQMAIDAAKFRAGQKAEPAKKPFQTPAPATKAAAAPGPKGLRGVMSKTELAQLAQMEKDFGFEYDDDMLDEEFQLSARGRVKR